MIDMSANYSVLKLVFGTWVLHVCPPSLSSALLLDADEFTFCVWGSALLPSLVHIFRTMSISLSCLSHILRGRLGLLFACWFQLHHPLAVPEVSARKMASWASSSSTVYQEASSIRLPFRDNTHWFECFQEEFRWFDILIYELLSQSGVNSFWLMKTILWEPSEVFSQWRRLLQSQSIWEVRSVFQLSQWLMVLCCLVPGD